MITYGSVKEAGCLECLVASARPPVQVVIRSGPPTLPLLSIQACQWSLTVYQGASSFCGSGKEHTMKQSLKYGERDYSFGQVMVTLRTAVGMTQVALAKFLGVSRRAVQGWEGGISYPKADHLKHLRGSGALDGALCP